MLKLLANAIAAELLPRSTRLLRGDRTAPALRHPPGTFRLVVVDEQLALLAVAPGHFVGDFDDGESAFEAVDGAEDVVHFFEGAAGCFGLGWGLELVGVDFGGEVYVFGVVSWRWEMGLRRRSTRRAR